MLWNSHLTHFAGQGHELCIVPEKSSISRFKTTTHYPASVSITKMNCWMGNIWAVMVLTSLFVCCVKSLFCASLFCLLKQQWILWLFRGWKWLRQCSWRKVVWWWNYCCANVHYAFMSFKRKNWWCTNIAFKMHWSELRKKRTLFSSENSFWKQIATFLGSGNESRATDALSRWPPILSDH